MNGCSGFSSIASHDHDRSPPTLGSTDKWTKAMNYKLVMFFYKWYVDTETGKKILSVWKIDLILTAKKEWLSNFHFSKKKFVFVWPYGEWSLRQKSLCQKSKVDQKISGWSLCQNYLTSTTIKVKNYLWILEQWLCQITYGVFLT
jgi:hypothetical protein